MALEGQYAPPGVYTETRFENALDRILESVKIPVLIGTGQELLTQVGLEVVRGSSSSVDQRVPDEDASGRAVTDVNATTGQVLLGSFDGTIQKFQVRNYPMVSGDGTGATTTDTSSVLVTINGDPSVVLSVDGLNGIIEISEAPSATDTIRVTYFFNRSDTQITDDVSNQVTTDPAVVFGQGSENFVILEGQNDVLVLTIDQNATVSSVLPSGDWTAPQMAAILESAFTDLTASEYTNNLGENAVRLQAAERITIGDGSANTLLGLTSGSSTSRNRRFFTFHGPIVDGTNGGITTTDPSDVTVLVGGTQVIPTSVDGQTRSVTLAFAPERGATVTVKYWFNSWQDTFDYLFHTGVETIERVGITPERNDFIEQADFVLKDDKIVWGTAALVSSAFSTVGSPLFGENQITTTLIDNRGFLEECDPVTNTSVCPAMTSVVTFQLPLVPTTGTGRAEAIVIDPGCTPSGFTPGGTVSAISTSLLTTIRNGRVDLPTNRPDLVVAYWGCNVQDALDQGPVEVASVDAAAGTITLRDPVPTGLFVFVTQYYNTLVDAEYTVEVITEGAAGVGEYRVTNQQGDRQYAATFGDKGAALATVTLVFPSGSELNPDARLESPVGDATLFEGPVEEIVTVTFVNRDDTPACFVFPGMDPYYFVAREFVVGPPSTTPSPYAGLTGGSNRFRATFDSLAAITGLAAGVDINDPTGTGAGFLAHIVSGEVSYDPATGTDFDITALNNEVLLTVDGQQIFAEATIGTGDVSDFVDAINTAADAVLPVYRAASRFTAYEVVATEYDMLSFNYTGDVATSSGVLTAIIAPGTYATPALLADALNTAVATEVATLGAAFAGLVVAVSSDASGRMFFTLTLPAGDAAGYLEFVDDAAPESDFAIIAGIDTDAAADGAQTKLLFAPIAKRFTVAGASGNLEHDRIILRNRIVPGSSSLHAANVEDQASLVVNGGSGAELLGLPTGLEVVARDGAVVKSATILGVTGWAEGQFTGGGDAQDGQPAVVFYDGTGIQAANDVFKFTFDGVPVVVEFPSSETGTTLALGPGAIAGTVMDLIAVAMVDVGLDLTVSDILADEFLRQEGAGIRLRSGLFSMDSRIEIGVASANDTLGFSSNDLAERSSVEASELASALMSHAQLAASVSTFWLTFAADGDYFAGRALAAVQEDDAGAQFLYIQSQTLGTSSSILIQEATADDVNLPGTGLLGLAGTGATGEAGVDGYVVTSSDTVDGSGSANTSTLNSGVGQDGVVGQTYRDAVTGLTFTLLPREGGGVYPVGATGFFTFQVSSIIRTNANIPVRAIPGIELLVTNTSQVPAGDSALVETFERGGQEPNIGDLYYATYDYRKQDFSTQLYSRLSTVVENYGEVSPDNPVSLGAFLQFLNGSVLTGITQVPKDEGSRSASESSYVAAVDSLAGSLPGLILPDLLIPLTPATESFAVFMGQHCDLQSSIRYRSERTCLLGFGSGTLPNESARIAQAVGRDRVRVLYPDLARITLTDAFNVSRQYLVDGTTLAAGFSGQIVSPNVDVATPWTNRNIVGFDNLARRLDAVTANQIATRGVTIVEEGIPFLKVRQGLTTDMSNVLTRTPTVRLIADEVQRQTRSVLNRFIGIKYLPTILGQVEGSVATMFKNLVRAQIVAAYTGVSAIPDATDPTTALVKGAYRPIFPLLFILVEYSLRST